MRHPNPSTPLCARFARTNPRDRETERDRERQRETERDRERQRETERDRERQRETERDRERQRETERDRETDRQRDRQTKRQRQRDRETGSWPSSVVNLPAHTGAALKIGFWCPEFGGFQGFEIFVFRAHGILRFEVWGK